MQQPTDVVEAQPRQGVAACAAIVGVDDAELRQVLDLPPRLAQTVAEVGILGAVEDGLVECAYLFECLATNHLACPDDIIWLYGTLIVGAHLLGGQSQSQHAQQLAFEPREGAETALHIALGVGHAAGAQPHVGMRVEVGKHAVDGASVGDGVVVQDEQCRRCGLGEALIAGRGHASIGFVDRELDQGIGLADIVGCAVGRSIVDDDDLGVATLHHWLQRLEAPPRVVQMVIGEDDD